MKIITIIGARPQFIKAAMFSQAIHQRAEKGHSIEEKILHTGQHYDYQMSDIFFQELHLPEPVWNIGCTALPEDMAQLILPVLRIEKPDIVVVFGDTNSTLAGALAAHACRIPIAHIEAGLRSFNSQMVEEHNRIQTDHLSTWLFCPTQAAVENLKKENITQGVYHVGDIMYDAALQLTPPTDEIIARWNLQKPFALATIHRAENTDCIHRLKNILLALAGLPIAVVWPMHPRTRKVIEQQEELSALLEQATNIHVIESVGYIEMAALEQHAQYILTDSGGVQKEAYFHRTPCITLRDETEWVETVETGWNTLVGTDIHRILEATTHIAQPSSEISEYGQGHTANNIVDILCASYL